MRRREPSLEEQIAELAAEWCAGGLREAVKDFEDEERAVRHWGRRNLDQAQGELF